MVGGNGGGARWLMFPSRPLLFRLSLTLAFALLGAGLLVWLLPGELGSIDEQLTGFPDSDVTAHRARAWILGGLCLLPALAMLGHALGDTLDRYLTRQFAVMFFICLLALGLVWLLADLADNLSDFRKSDNTLRTAAVFYGTRWPAVVVLMMPYALLLSLIYTLGKLSRDRELVAMIQSGRSVLRVTRPLLGAGLWCSLLCLGLNYHWAPGAEGRKRELLAQARGELVTAANHVLYFNRDHRRLWMVGGFPRHYERGEPLLAVEVTTTDPDGTLISRLSAKRARWLRENGDWEFENPVLCRFPEGEPPAFQSPGRLLVLSGWPETPWQLIKPGLPAEYLGVPDLNSWLRANSLKPLTRPNQNATAPYLTQWHYRWALPFTCLVTVLLAAPVSIHFSRREHGGNVFLALVLSVLMLISGSIALSFGEAGHIPPALAAWAPNLFFTLLGLYLFRIRIAGRRPLMALRRLFRSKS